jgi:hypothetical protein
VTQPIIYQVLSQCAVNLTNDENLSLQALLTSMRDPTGQLSLLDFLQFLGLPAQTLGIRALKPHLRRVLTDSERKKCQSLIFGLRKELNYAKKRE